MTIHIDMNVLIACLSGIIGIIIGVVIALIVDRKRMKRILFKLEEQNRLLYFTHRDYDEVKYEIAQIHDELEGIETNTHDLVSYLVEKRQEEMTKPKVYPRPDLSRQITETIREQIQMKFALSHEMSAPKKDLLLADLTRIVAATYPEVDPEVITYRCIAVVEEVLQGLQQKLE